METREAAAGHNPLPCPQHLPVQGVPVLNLCALKCTFSVLVIGSRLLEELPGVVVNTFPNFPTAISTPLSRVVDLKL